MNKNILYPRVPKSLFQKLKHNAIVLSPQLLLPSMRLRRTKFSIQNLSHMQLRVAWWHVPWPEHSF